MAATDTTVNVMLFEAGALAQQLIGNSQAQALARKLEDAYGDAMSAGNLAFDIGLNPFEVGMAFGAASNNSGILSQKMSGKLREALKAKLEELGVSYDGAAGQQADGLGAEAQADGNSGQDGLGAEQPAGDDAPADSNADDDGGQGAL